MVKGSSNLICYCNISVDILKERGIIRFFGKKWKGHLTPTGWEFSGQDVQVKT